MTVKQERHLLDLSSLGENALERLLDRACALAAGAAPKKRQGAVANLFREPSTRTRVSFELAARRLGLDVIHIEPDQSSTTKGESLHDTLATLAAMGVRAAVLRHRDEGLIRKLASGLEGMALVNAGEGQQAHPSQALLDVATLLARGRRPAGLRLAIVGDIRHSRVAASACQLWQRLGAAEIRLAGPPGLLPDTPPVPAARLCKDLRTAITGADVIMLLRIQRERMDATGWPDEAAYFSSWGLTRSLLDELAPQALLMHPGPVNRGVEIEPALVEDPRSLILQQVRMGVFTRMAIFEWLLN